MVLIVCFYFISCQNEAKKEIKDKFDDYLLKSIESYDNFDYIESLDYASNAHEIAVESGDSEMKAKAYTLLSLVYSNLGLYNESLFYADKTLKEKFTKSDIDTQRIILDRKGYVYLNLGLYEQARSQYIHIIQLAEKTHLRTVC